MPDFDTIKQEITPMFTGLSPAQVGIVQHQLELNMLNGWIDDGDAVPADELAELIAAAIEQHALDDRDPQRQMLDMKLLHEAIEKACPSFDFTIETPEDVTYTPWTDGHAVGFKCTHSDGRSEFIYMNPSSGDTDGEPNVFIYQGEQGDPGIDGTLHYYNVFA